MVLWLATYVFGDIYFGVMFKVGKIVVIKNM